MDVIFNGISAVVEGFMQLVLLLFKSLFRLALAGNSGLPAEDRRRHLAAGLLGLAFVVVVIAIVAGFLWYADFNARRRGELARQEAEAHQAASGMVAASADKLHQQIDDTDHYLRAANPLPDKDPWGRALCVDYSKRAWGESLVVRSLGKDGIAGTEDDITAARHNLRAADAGRQVGAKIADEAKQRWNRWRGLPRREEEEKIREPDPGAGMKDRT